MRVLSREISAANTGAKGEYAYASNNTQEYFTASPQFSQVSRALAKMPSITRLDKLPQPPNLYIISYLLISFYFLDDILIISARYFVLLRFGNGIWYAFCRRYGLSWGSNTQRAR